MSDMELIPLLCLLALWAGCTSTQEIRPGPGVVNVPEGGNALLGCAQASGQSVDEFDWRKDNGDEEKKEVFMYKRGSYYGNGLPGQDQQFKGRVDFFQHKLESGNASILIKNTHLEDNGTYTCGLGLDMYKRQEVHIRLNVGAARVPYIQMVHDKTTWRILECKVTGVPEPEVEWRNSAGQVLEKHNPKSEDKRSHVELQLKVTKSDNYTCVATQRDIYHQINNTMEASFPEAVAVSEGDDAILPCSFDTKHDIGSIMFTWNKDEKEVYSYDRGRVKEGEIITGRLTLFPQELMSGNASIKIHNTQKSDSGRYTCHFKAVQKSHVFLQIVGKKSDPEALTGWIVAAVLGALLVFVIVSVIIGALWYYTYSRRRSNELLKFKGNPLPEHKVMNDTCLSAALASQSP